MGLIWCSPIFFLFQTTQSVMESSLQPRTKLEVWIATQTRSRGGGGPFLSPQPTPGTTAAVTSLLFACGGDSGGSDPATVALLSGMIQQYVCSLATLVLDTSVVRLASLPLGSAAAAASAAVTLDSTGVAAVLRAAGQGRAAEQVDATIKQHRQLQLHGGLTVSIGGGDEATGWKHWGEAPPPPALVATGLEERAKFLAIATGDTIFPLPPPQPQPLPTPPAPPPSAAASSSSGSGSGPTK